MTPPEVSNVLVGGVFLTNNHLGASNYVIFGTKEHI